MVEGRVLKNHRVYSPDSSGILFLNGTGQREKKIQRIAGISS